MGCPRVFRVAFRVQPLCRVRILEFHGRSVFTGPRQAPVRDDRCRRQRGRIARSLRDRHLDVFLPDCQSHGALGLDAAGLRVLHPSP